MGKPYMVNVASYQKTVLNTVGVIQWENYLSNHIFSDFYFESWMSFLQFIKTTPKSILYSKSIWSLI